MGNANQIQGFSNSISGIGSLAGAFQGKASLNASADLIEKTNAINTKMAELQAKDAIRRGEGEVKKLRQGIQHVVGSQRAAFAAQGIQVDSGSALAVQESTNYVGELDVITLRNNAFREAFGFKLQAIKQNLKGTIESSTARFNAGNTLLTGGADFFASSFKATQNFKAGATPDRGNGSKLAGGNSFGGSRSRPSGLGSRVPHLGEAK